MGGMIIALDGPAGTGKSTVSQRVAEEIGVFYLNSGSFYRALTLAVIRAQVDVRDEKVLEAFCRERKIEYKKAEGKMHLILDGEDVESLLHSDEVTGRVSAVSAVPGVRHLVNELMRKITKSLDIICEGRDMATVVFPNAEYKFYLDASADVRAKRRFTEGVSNMTLEEVKAAIMKRDEDDKHKKEGALVISKDAQYIDTTDLTIDEVCGIITDKIREGQGSAEAQGTGSLQGHTMDKKEVQMNAEGKAEEAASSQGNIQTQLEASLNTFNPPEEGQVVDGVVIEVAGDTVFIDVGCKSEGRLPLSEFQGERPASGDTVQVKLIKRNGRGGPEISKKLADEKRLWRDITQAFKEKTAVEGTITKTVKGGFEVDLGGNNTAFLPISQSDRERVDNPETMVGLKAKFYVERLYSDGKVNIVVNRRKYLEESAEKEREKFFATAKIGDTVKGVVKSFTSFGAFIDLGGFDGLLHINDMSWGHVARPKDFVKKGKEIELKLIRMDPVEKRINLSLKHFTEDPWMHFEDKYHVNDIVKGKVTKLTDFGAFVEVSEGIEGLVHVSELSWTKKVAKPSDVLKVGDEVECMILGYDIQAGRVSLGLKQVTANPWDKIEENYPIGSKVHGTVAKITNAGAFITLEDGIDGFLHGEDVSWTKKVKHVGSEVKEGQEVDAIVLDNTMRRIKLGLKQLTPNPWEAFAKNHKSGTTFEGEVASITDFGVFVKTDSGIEGLVNKSSLSEDREVPYEEAVKKYKVGDKINVYVVDVNVEKEKAAFSVREYKKAQERAEMSEYMSKSDNAGAYTLGDMIGNINVAGGKKKGASKKGAAK